MSLYKRHKIYWFSLMYDGNRIFASLKTDNKKVAERRFAKVMTDIIEGRYFETSKAKKYSFDEMVAKYLEDYEKSRDQETLKKLNGYFKNMRIYDMTTEKVADYKRLRDKDVKPATVYQELSLLRRMFNVARREWKWVKENPVADLSFSVGDKNARDRWLTVEEEKKLLKVATNPQWLRPLLITALHTGMRRSEILSLEWRDVDFQRRIILVRQSKNGEQRTIPMSQTLYNTLRAMKVRNITGQLFGVSQSTLRDAFHRTITKAEVLNFRFHDCRHTFASRLIQQGVDPYKVQLLLGHKSFSMTRRYAHHNVESLRNAVDVLDRCDKSVTIEEAAIDR